MEGEEESYPNWKTYVVPVLESTGIPPNSLKILVTACGESDMTEQLYNLGYLHITSVDASSEVILSMMRRHKDRPELKWRLWSTMKFGSNDFNVVIAKGGLDALSSEAEIMEFMTKVSYLKEKEGWKFILFTRCKSETIALLLHFYYWAYKTTFQKLGNDNSIMIVVERAEIDLPLIMPEHDREMDTILRDTIYKENSRRYKALWDCEISLANIQNGVFGDPRIISEGRKFRFQHDVGKEKYDILVFDIALPVQVQAYSWEIIFTQSQKIVSLNSEDDWSMISWHSRAPRVCLVLLDESQEKFKTKRLKRNIRDVFNTLAPKDCRNFSHRCRKIAENDLFNCESEICIGNENNEIADETLSGELLVDEDGEGVDESFNDELNRGIDEDDEVVPEECTLTEWVFQNSEARDVWCQQKEGWNHPSFKATYKLDGVEGWNSSRPTNNTCQVIEGVIAAVADFQSRTRSGVYGNLRDTDCYVMSNQMIHLSGIPYPRVHVTLNSDLRKCSKSSSISKDMEDLEYIVFKVILKDHELPRLWVNLKNLIRMFNAGMSKEDLAINWMLLKNHPSCWHWRKRIEFVDVIAKLTHDNTYCQKKILIKILSVIREGLKWKDLIPKDTPIARVLLSKIAQSYTDDSFDMLRYNKNVFGYILQKGVGGKYVYIFPKELIYRKYEFIEVLLMEIFPDYVVDLVAAVVKQKINPYLY